MAIWLFQPVITTTQEAGYYWNQRFIGEAVEPISSFPEHLNQAPIEALTYNIKLIVCRNALNLVIWII